VPAHSIDLRGRNALVTGAGAGHGRAIALALAAQGASVAVSDINIERAERTCDEIHALGGTAIALQADISNRFQTANMIEMARDAFGKIHLLANATAISHPEAMLSIDEWNWRRQLEINITGIFFCMQLLGRVMADEGGGVMINLASVDGLGAKRPHGIGYMASQAAVIAMTQQAARELASHRIRVNAIVTGCNSPNAVAASNPSGAPRLGTSSVGNITETALFLSSNAAQEMTGQVLVADRDDSAE